MLGNFSSKYLVPGMCVAPFDPFATDWAFVLRIKQLELDICQLKRKLSIRSLNAKDNRHNFSGAVCKEHDSSNGKFQTFGKPRKKQLWGRCWAKIGFRKTQADVYVEGARVRVLDRYR